MKGTSYPYPDTFHPQLRSEIRFGPPMLIRGSKTYVMKDTFTRWYYEINALEYFVLSRMDGSRTIQQIDAEIQDHYGRSLHERAWESLFKLFEERQLLVDSAEKTKLEELTRAGERSRWKEHQTLLRHRFSVVKPDRFLEKILPWVRFVFHPLFVLPAIITIVILEIYVLLHIPAMVVESWQARNVNTAIPIYLIFLIFLTVLPIFHELAHGLACKYYGGSITEMGIIWRYMSFLPYCKLDDIMLFPKRWHRVYAAFAGVFFSLLMLIPFWILWLVTPDKSPLREYSSLVLTIYNLGMLINFIPFLELDGYFMLAHALNMPDLRQASNEFWGRKLAKLLFKQEEFTRHAHPFGRGGRKIYFYYGIVSIAITTLFVSVAVYYWIVYIRNIVGDIVTWVLLGGLGLYILYKLFMATYRLLALRHPRVQLSQTQIPTHEM